MKRVVIIGGGFAGLAAAGELRGRAEVTLVDRKRTFDFLPMLPDLLSRRLDPELLEYDLASLGEALGFRFLNAEVSGVDLAARSVSTSAGPLPCEFLVAACGSETNFYGRDDLRERVLTLDSVADARRILKEIERGGFATALVVGGGYTGIETATNLRRFLPRRRRVMIVETGPSLVGALPPWMRAYVERNVRAMGIEVVRGTTLKEMHRRDAVLADGRVVPDALVVWAAGVQTGDAVRRLDAQKAKQGRLVVDEFLRLCPSPSLAGPRDKRPSPSRGEGECFVAGDAACVMQGGMPLRMAVQIALDEGRVAGANVAALIAGRPLRRYRPVDPGWVVPMRNDRSCGKALGFPVRGFAAIALHYLMCLVRSAGLARRARMLAQVIARR